MAQAYAYARQAGFDPASAVTAAAVAAAGGSGLNPAAIGDEDLADAKWGPPVGLMQVHALKSATGTGGTRDIQRLAGDPLAQMAAAYEISGHGRDFTPWPVYTSGAYRQFLGQAQSVAGAGYVPGANVVPVSWQQDTGRAVGQLAVLAVAVVLGVGLVVLGAARATGADRPIGRAAAKAAKLAVLA